ncbi:Glu-tRNA(Gln) amidotransferase subunit GatD [archaeon]|jgi:glutamyl-tRNA(Gln) amidotransferase subunit D|nr:Glu-tRNA(Gln) amidotransferase subunit GatD [archaeon]MBT4373798.1 Glu-tRNA(Gln) amidotransferase subunit GatD [archaeon]MBT4532264.1 Glu-tRNA(Gln) amidotransferase subunit GatD [archaeon]MBT7001089.1 Glu-tRNA(Gln) amidotransferase subunit GatD [archaeon]MBT7281978.1 Glu-tRNA(Gln) amidotransferase subunit GatD [archaeon]
MEKTNAKSGDYVEVHLTQKIYEGVLLESSEDEKNIILLKLDNGYNIGFLKKDIQKIIVNEKAKESKEELNIKKDNSKPNVGMIITGGTIAARLNPKKGGVDWVDTPESLFKYYPGIFDKVNISKIDVPFMKASEDMDFKDWQKIARSADKMLNDSNIQGIIVTHGTDFLHYTSAALSFFLRDLNKPVVLTYSQRSIDRASSDANLNLQCSALVAISDIAEVMLVGHSSSDDDYCDAMIGTKVRKLHSTKRAAFKSVNVKPLAKVYPGEIDILGKYQVRNKGKVKLDIKFEEKVALVKFYPGMSPEILDYYLKKKYNGIVLEMGALGHVATKRARLGWTKKLKEVQEKGMIVCGVTQCIFGRTDPLVYSNGRELLATGIIYLEDMLAETAFVKLGWVLGHEDWAKDKELVKEKMLENIAGELNDRLEE